MSKFTDKIAQAEVCFVLPFISKLEYIKISDTDRALCFIVKHGYVECSDIESCLTLVTYLEQGSSNRIKRIGFLDEVVSLEGKVYRCRMIFSDIRLVLGILGKLGVSLRLDKTFSVGALQLSNCSSSLEVLNVYARKKSLHYTLEKWLTDCCMSYIELLSVYFNVQITSSTHCLVSINDGLLVRSPYLCGNIGTEVSSKASIVVFSEKSINEIAGVDYNTMKLTGFTTSNVLMDMQSDKSCSKEGVG